MMDEGVLLGKIAPSSRLTIFQRAGWLFGPISLISTIALMAHAIFLALKRRKKAH